ncbi:MAG: glycosyltransferase [Bradyrhizobium sp.]|uniref:glycosyltransferase n=1 Tax=Bradyrhizobium sp. TaxID=376 RepID=UPI0027293D9E|nr:glycosyltransferase [Bradyrhizobium sp.]MDO8400510.1 glycosyltransferase [Bradyrhizobium sp.]
MKIIIVSLKDKSVELRLPTDWEQDVRLLFGSCVPSTIPPCTILTVIAEASDRYTLQENGTLLPPMSGLSRPDALIQLSEIVASRLAAHIRTGTALHAGAVGWNGRSILIPGLSGAGKSSLTAWLVDKGFSYLTDELVILTAHGALVGLPRALMLKPDADIIISRLPRFADSPSLRVGQNFVLRPDAPADADLLCGLIIFPAFITDAGLTIEPLTAAKACFRLMGCNVNARNLADGGFAAISELARRVPAIELRYGAFEQLDGVVDTLASLMLDAGISGDSGRRFMTAFAGVSVPSTIAPAQTTTAPAVRHPIPAPTPRRGSAKLTIGMATYDDYDGVYFSLQAIRMYHPEIVAEAEFIVVDNHPDGACAGPLKALELQIPNYRYIPEATRSGTAVKGRVFDEASGELVLCMDCHVFVLPGALKKLLGYFADNAATSDLLQGPLLYDDLKSLATHFRPEWRGGMYGVWDNNGLAADPNAAPFDIPMQGMGLFACRRAAWPGFNGAFRGFGGEEGYIHEKFRQAGGRTLCLPFLRWIHRFHRPMGVPYRNVWEDRIWNYLVGFRELGLPTVEMEAHFCDLLGQANASQIIERLKQEPDEA